MKKSLVLSVVMIIVIAVLVSVVFSRFNEQKFESLEQKSGQIENLEKENADAIISLNITDGTKNADEKENPAADSISKKNIDKRIVVDHTATNLENIPKSCIENAKENINVAYTHTSHGSQIVSGMDAIKEYDSFYELGNKFSDYGGFLGACPDLSQCDGAIASPTKKFLDNSDNQDVNVIMWSWCDIAGHDIDTYLEDMQKLIFEYEEGSSKHPVPVRFVFMTGHANGGGEGDSSDSQNKKIRDFFYDDSNGAFCETHECILFDFSDMENYDPDGNYYLDKNVNDALIYDGGNWGSQYLKKYPSGTNAELTDLVSGCAHSDGEKGSKLNCALKGQAAWYMYARIAGWDGESKSC